MTEPRMPAAPLRPLWLEIAAPEPPLPPRRSRTPPPPVATLVGTVIVTSNASGSGPGVSG